MSTTFKQLWFDFSSRQRRILVFIALIIAVVAISRGVRRPVNDFVAYHTAAQRFLASEPYYVAEVSYPFKYPPPTLLLFLPLGLVDYSVAKVIWVIANFLWVMAIPLLLLLLLEPQTESSRRKYFFAILSAFLCSLRFLEPEFQENQVSSLIACFILAFAVFGEGSRRHRGIQILAAPIGLLKAHSGLAFIPFFLRQRSLSFFLCVLIMSFSLGFNAWLLWIRQISETSEFITIGTGGALQGLYPLALRWLPESAAKLSVMIVFALGFVGLWIYSQAWKLSTWKTPKVALFSLLLFLWSTLCSPLPWQHNFSLLWALVPLIYWHVSSQLEKRVFWVLVLLLAISPKDIWGAVGKAFENHQGPFALLIAMFIFGALALRSSANTGSLT